jgi:hypothetical protein
MRGQKITPEKIERIKAAYIETESLAAAAKAASVSKATAAKYIRISDEFEQVRTEKRTALIGDVAGELAAVRQLYLDHLKEPAVIAAATAKDSAIIVGVFTDKHQLVTGEATERTEHVNPDDARTELSRRIDELAKRRQARTDRESERSGS